MASVHVVTDSGSDLPKEVQKTYGISVVPLSIQFGDDIYKDGVELEVERFYEMLTTGSVLPSTCQPSPADFVDMYERIAEPGDSIISVHLSSQLSGTYQSAVLASSMVEGIDITVVDTKSASMGIGLVAVAAAEALQNGASKEEAVAAAEKTAEELGVYFVVDTLEYLQKNGRIGRAQALMGTLLNIKPILTLDDGVVTPFDKVRGRAKALNKIKTTVEQYKEQYQGRRLRLALTHSNCEAEARKLASALQEMGDVEEPIVSFIGPTIGVHVGPGTVALLFHPM